MERAIERDELNVVSSSLMMKVFYAFAGMALLSICISLTGRWMGGSIAMGGHSDDTSTREIVIGNNVLLAPANMIRFERQRLNGIAPRLDLYMKWPEMTGYTRETGDDFNNARGQRNIIFLSFEPQIMSRDMSGRFQPIYRSLIVSPPSPGPVGLQTYAFTEKSGYLNEMLVVGNGAQQQPFVARCMTGASADESLAPCERDILVGESLSLTYRFPSELLGQWKDLDARVAKAVAGMLKR